MTILEKVALALRRKCKEIERKPRLQQRDAIWLASWFADEYATTAITAFLKAAAEEGWHMQRDEVTEEMRIANCELDCGYAVCHKAAGGPRCINHGGRRKYSDESWNAMLSAAPKFEWISEGSF